MNRPSSHQMFTQDPLLHQLRRHEIPAGPLVAVLLTTVAAWRHCHRTRRQLAGLDSHELRDIGLAPDRARQEAGKPFWRA